MTSVSLQAADLHCKTFTARQFNAWCPEHTWVSFTGLFNPSSVENADLNERNQDKSHFCQINSKIKSWLRFPHCLLCALPNFSHWVPTEAFIWPCCPWWRGRAWTCCNRVSHKWKAGLDWETDLTSALLSAPRRSGWWMGSNQQQTDLPQETSPHHVYGNQHFSRDPLIATEEEEGWRDRKTIGFSLIFCKENQDRLLFTDQNMIYRPAAKWHPWTIQQHRAWLTWKQFPKTYFGNT